MQSPLLMVVFAVGICYFAYIAFGLGLEVGLEYALWAIPYVFLPLGMVVKDRCEWLAAVSYSVSLAALIAFAIIMLSPI